MSDFQSKIEKTGRYAVYDPRSNTIRCYRDGELMITLSSYACSSIGSEYRNHVLERWVKYGCVVL